MTPTDSDLSRDDEAERACEDLRDQIERARTVVEQYRQILPEPPSGDHDRDRRN